MDAESVAEDDAVPIQRDSVACLICLCQNIIWITLCTRNAKILGKTYPGSKFPHKILSL